MGRKNKKLPKVKKFKFFAFGAAIKDSEAL
jgi:hypothetical protein